MAMFKMFFRRDYLLLFNFAMTSLLLYLVTPSDPQLNVLCRVAAAEFQLSHFAGDGPFYCTVGIFGLE